MPTTRNDCNAPDERPGQQASGASRAIETHDQASDYRPVAYWPDDPVGWVGVVCCI